MSEVFVAFLIGMFLGCLCGVTIMAILYIARSEE
jgi:hypothetical protein